MKKYMIRVGQTIFDLAVQHYGSSEAVAWLLFDNPQATWAHGEVIIIRSNALDNQVVKKMKNKILVSK